MKEETNIHLNFRVRVFGEILDLSVLLDRLYQIHLDQPQFEFSFGFGVNVLENKNFTWFSLL